MSSKNSRRKSNRAKQSRNMCIMTYCPGEHIQKVIEFHSDLIRAYAYIYHDRFSPDELGDKETKEPHYHIVLRLNVPMTESAVSKWFTYYNEECLKQRVDCISTDDPFESYDYLTHKHSPEKFQFSELDVTVSDSTFFTRNRSKFSDDNALNALDDLIHDVDVYTICKRYGRDIIYHLSQLQFAKYLITNSDRNLTFNPYNHFDEINNLITEKE